jgi:hypothetical protein
MNRFAGTDRLFGIFFSAALLIASCASAGDKTPPKDARAESAAGLSFAVPKDWAAGTPTSAMRAAQFALPAEKEGGDTPELVLFFFGSGQGGNTQANIDRWIGQMQQADGKSSAEKAKRESRKVGKYTVSLVTVDGSYAGGMMGGMGANPHADPHGGGGTKSDYRLWAAVVEGDGGPWFFKATGPKGAMEKAATGFDALVASLKPGPAAKPTTD